MYNRCNGRAAACCHARGRTRAASQHTGCSFAHVPQQQRHDRWLRWSREECSTRRWAAVGTRTALRAAAVAPRRPSHRRPTAALCAQMQLPCGTVCSLALLAA